MGFAFREFKQVDGRFVVGRKRLAIYEIRIGLPSLGKIDLIDLDACLVKAIIGVAGDDRRIFAAVVSRRQLLEPRLAKIYALRGY